MAYEVGSSLEIRNVQHLTPLTLSAKLARIEMFFHILNIEREIYWQIGSITCAAYPLSQIDTIDVNTGTINKNSALNLVVFGVSEWIMLIMLFCRFNTHACFTMIVGQRWTFRVNGRCASRSSKRQVEHFRQISVRIKEKIFLSVFHFKH